jgi:hypothetical protein
MSLFNYKQLHAASGKPKGRSLFREWAPPEIRDQALFTLKKYDDAKSKSLYKLYMTYAIDDPTEVTFSEAVFGSHAFWLTFRGQTPVKEVIDEWEDEAERIRLSRQIEVVLEATKNERTSLSAAKFLLGEGHKLRPSYEAKDGRAARKANREKIKETIISEAFAEDIARLQELDRPN